MSDGPVYYTDYGIMCLTHHIAETYSKLLHRADDDKSAAIRSQAGQLLEQAQKLLDDRWEWSKENPPRKLTDL